MLKCVHFCPSSAFSQRDLMFRDEEELRRCGGSVGSDLKVTPMKTAPSNLQLPVRVNQPHLGHEAVCVGVLLVLEDDVWVVVAHQLVEALGVARDLALCSPAGAQVVLGQVGEKLLIVHGLQLPGPGADAVAGPGPASLDHPYAAPRSQQADLCQARPPTLLHRGRFPGISGSR